MSHHDRTYLVTSTLVYCVQQLAAVLLQDKPKLLKLPILQRLDYCMQRPLSLLLRDKLGMLKLPKPLSLEDNENPD